MKLGTSLKVADATDARARLEDDFLSPLLRPTRKAHSISRQIRSRVKKISAASPRVISARAA
jgi:hypothetical protein